MKTVDNDFELWIKLNEVLIIIIVNSQIDMSLFIVGSCSKITRNIIIKLAKNNQYEQITVADVLPTYDFHQRYYQLRADLAQAKLKTQVDL